MSSSHKLAGRARAVAIVAVLAAVGGGLIITALRETRQERVTPTVATPADRVRQTLFAEIQPVRLANCTLERFGEERDGGYLLCANLLSQVDAGYSYGISGYDGWGCDISKRLDVRVHQYDCFDTRSTSCPGGDMAFHAECVSGSTYVDEDGRRFETMPRQFARNGDAIRHVVVKMDVEGAEWDALPALTTDALGRIDQLVVEFHQVHEERFISVFRRLKEHFHVVNVHYNNYSCDAALTPFPSWAYEVLLVNKRLGQRDGSNAPVGRHPLDRANTTIVPDCQAAPATGGR